MEITKELLNTIYDRAIQYAMASTGEYEKPARIRLLENGKFEASWDKYSYGSYTEETYFDFSNLSENLDEVIRLRKIEEEKLQLEREEKWAKEQRAEKQRKEAEEKQKYLQLKAKYEGTIN